MPDIVDVICLIIVFMQRAVLTDSFHYLTQFLYVRALFLLTLLFGRFISLEHGQDKWSNGLIVQDCGSHELRMVQPH